MSSLSSFSRKETIFMRKTFFNATFQNQVIILQKHLTIHHYLKNIPHFHVPPNLWSICWQLHLCTLLPRIFITLTPCCHHCFLLFGTWGFLIWMKSIFFSHELLWDEIKVFIFTFLLFMMNYWSFECNTIFHLFINFLMLVHVYLMIYKGPNEFWKRKLSEILCFLNYCLIYFPLVWYIPQYHHDLLNLGVGLTQSLNLFIISTNLVNISSINSIFSLKVIYNYA